MEFIEFLSVREPTASPMMSRPKFYSMIKHGELPKPIKARGSLCWTKIEIEDVHSQLIAKRDVQ